MKNTQPLLFELDPTFTNRGTKAVTFRGKMDMPIHRWYRLTPSFSPALADDIANHFGLSASDLVLDPFSGVGTVPLCMKYRGIPACSVELNPYLHFVGTVKTRTYGAIEKIERYFTEFMKAFRTKLKAVPFEDRPAFYLAEQAQHIPKINFPERWWSKGNLAQLVCLRKLLTERFEITDIHDLLRMGALAILIPISNAKHNHVSLTYAEKPLRTIDLAEVLEQKLQNMIADLHSVSDLPKSDVVVYSGNSKELSRVLPLRNRKISSVITSPPYKPVQLRQGDETAFVLF